MKSYGRWLRIAAFAMSSTTIFATQIVPPKPSGATPSASAAVNSATLLQWLLSSPFSKNEFEQFLADAKRAEAIHDPLKRCLSYPEPPSLAWSKTVTSAYCHFQLDPLVSPTVVRELIRTNRAAELDRRLARGMKAQLSRTNAQGVLDSTYSIDFKNDSEETRALIDAWKRQSPKSAFALAASGTSYVQMAQSARGTDSSQATPENNLESMHRLMENAREDLDEAVLIDPRVLPAYGSMILAAAFEGDREYATNAARRGLAIDPANYSIYARLAWKAQPKWGGSIPMMQRVIAQAAAHAADNPLLRLISSESNDAEDYVSDCNCSPAEEIDIYKRVFAEAGPVGMLLSAGSGAESRNAPILSTIYRSESLRFDPTQLSARIGRVSNLTDVGDTQWALSEANALVAIAPQNENVFDARGRIYQTLGDLTHAVQDFERALRISPEDTWTLSTLGSIYVYSVHDWDKGWEISSRLIQAAPDNPQGWLLRARIQRDQPRAGLNETEADFVARFGDDPKQQAAIEEMRAALK